MKELRKVLPLLLLLLAVAAAPWLLLQRQSVTADGTVHREPVDLESQPSGDGASVPERLKLIEQAVYSDNTYAITPLSPDSPSVVMRQEMLLEQLETLQDSNILPRLELGTDPALDCKETLLVEFYDISDASRSVQLLLAVFTMESRYTAFAAMDMETGLFYTISLWDALEELNTDLAPSSYLFSYLGLSGDVLEDLSTASNGFGLFGSLFYTGEYQLEFYVTCTNSQISYSPGFLESAGVIPY